MIALPREESRKKLPPLSSLPAKWQAEYRRVLPLAIERYGGQWGGRAECEYQIHLYVCNCWKAEDAKSKAKPDDGQGLLFG